MSVEAKLEKQRSTDFETKDWSAAQYILEKYIRKTLETGIPEGADAWNINVPDGLKFPYPERRTVQSRQSYFYFEKPEKRIYSEPCRLRSKKDVDIQSLESDSDNLCHLHGSDCIGYVVEFRYVCERKEIMTVSTSISPEKTGDIRLDKTYFLD